MESVEFIDAFTSLLEDKKLQGRSSVPISKENRGFLRQLYKLGAPSPVASPMSTAYQRPAPQPSPTAPRTMPKPSAPPTAPQPAAQVQPVVNPAFQAIPVANTAEMHWQDLEQAAKGCQACALCPGRQHVVFDTGNRNADIMFIGDFPGDDEDQQGLPFVGKAGQLLTKIIGAMKFSRDDVYITTVIKCRPPENRNPEQTEADTCMHFLKRQIELVNPNVIVLLGAIPLQYLMNTRGIMRSRGIWMTYNNIPVMPTYHPSFLLRKPENKRAVWEDMQQVMSRLANPPATPGYPDR